MQTAIDLIPARVRKVAYAIYAFVGVGIGAVQTAFIAGEAGQPAWLTISMAVFSYIGIAFGFVAAKNTIIPTVSITDRNTAAHVDVAG